MAYQPPQAQPFVPGPSNYNYGGGGAGGPTAMQNNVMLQMGLTYGQSILNQGIQQGQQNFVSSYASFFTKLQCYFCVDNAYVRRKLGLLVFPFFRHFPKVEARDSIGSPVEGYNSASPLGMGADESPASPFGGPVGESMSHRHDRRTASTSIPALPIHDYFAFDLYLPLMGAITYVILSAFIYGIVHKGSVKSDSLLSTSTVIAVWLVLEAIALKVLAYVLRVVHGAALLDIVSLCGYKYILVCLTVLLRQAAGLNRNVLYLPPMIYIAAANGFFSIKSLIQLSTRDDGRVPPRARLFAYISAVVQVPSILWLCARPFL